MRSLSLAVQTNTIFHLSNQQQMSYLGENTNFLKKKKPGQTKKKKVEPMHSQAAAIPIQVSEMNWQRKPTSIELKQWEEFWQQQVKREKLIRNITEQIRQSLNVQEVLEIAVAQVQQFLQCDRSFIYRFDPDWSGVVLAESVAAGWKPILGKILIDPCFAQNYVQLYREGRIQATADIYAGGLSQCHIDFLAQLQIRANLVVPILQGPSKLWGLLIANHCAKPRQWQQLELNLLQELATQMALAIQQSELSQQVTSELAERKQIEKSLQQNQEYLHQIIATISDSLIIVDRNGIIRFVNPAAESLFGRNREQLLEQSFGLPCLFGENSEISIPHANGELMIAEMRVAEITWEHDIAYLVSLRDITERYQAEKAIQESEEKYRRIVETASEGIWIIDSFGKTSFVNRQITEMLGYTVEEMMGKSLFDFMDEEGRAIVQAQVEHYYQAIYANQDLKFRRQDGTDLWTIVSTNSFFDDDGNYVGTLNMVTDITERKRVEKQLQHNAFYDPLTDLPNRALFLARLEQALRQIKQHPNYLFAVLFLDLDGFKLINDSLGHTSGDRLLQAIAHRLETCLRPNDTLARLGGDEFTILLEDIKDVQNALKVAERIHHYLSLPFTLKGQQVFTNASIGIALSALNYREPDEILRDADTAMYRAKLQGKGCHTVFAPQMYHLVVSRLQLETDLRQALVRKQFEVYYQPIVSLKTGTITGFEALIRWQHPDKGLVSPAEFITIAEETQLIAPIGQWILKEACQHLFTWQKQFPSLTPLKISVNLSSKQLKEANFIEQIDEILAITGLEASSLKLEITESLLMENLEVASDLFLELRKRNIELSLDDFGTGYSSLSYLHRFPVNTLKIDRSFISMMKVGARNVEIVRAIIALAHILEMDVIAEGIETEEQMKQLKALNCEQGQGYFFSQPLDRQAAEALLRLL